MNRFIIIATILLGNIAAHAQEQLAMRTSNYAGVNGLTLNPANGSTSPFKWDVNLLEFGQFFDNNYLFIENFSLLSAAKIPEDYALRPDLIKKDQSAPLNTLVVDFYRNTGKTFRGDALTNVMGPSLMLRLGESNIVGLYTRARFAFNARKIPAVLGYYEFDELPFGTPVLADAFNINVMAWSEIGLNYTRIAETDYGQISIGGTLKYLQGYESAYVRNEQSLEVTQQRGNRLTGTPGHVRYGFSSSVVEDSVWQLQKHGSGAALDVGMVFTALADGDDYKWKFGVSLLDVGAIRFNQAAQQHELITRDTASINTLAYQQFDSPQDLDSVTQIFSRQILQDPNASLQSRAFGMWLPTALSVQAEVAIVPSLFVNATVIQGIPFAKNAIQRSSMAALTPRFERRWFEAALPISLLNWKKLRSGLAVRVAFLWFGTEDLGSIFKKSDFDSTDFYFAIKVNPFKLTVAKSDSNKRSGGYQGKRQSKIRARGGSVKCPKF